ncbi:helix-turn-helix domain-containing protein [Nocardia sp. NPDC051990]|uniref:TetR/AcrR family transcriptional regulator n=1 Tax=Nocardia sp. NPDC051990 TaxID=3155285 RepID=UPI003432E318
MSSPSSPSRPRRKDAARNRDRILATARNLFAQYGSEVQLPEVARAAGVGIGTVYRHFPTRSDLIEAAAAQRFAEIEEYARTACLDPADPGRALLRYLTHVGETLAADHGLSAAIEAARHSRGSEPRGPALERLAEILDVLIESDRAAGTVRADLTVADIYMIVGALSATIRSDSGDWQRLLTLLYDGLWARSR